MTTTPTDKRDTTARRPPQQRRPAEPRGYGKARTEFEKRAQAWLLARPARTMCVPEDVRQIVNAVGVPGDRCCALIYRDRDAGHIIAVTALPNWFGEDAGGRHWASAITAACPAACRR